MPGPWQTFKSWHDQEFWKTIYRQILGTLISAFVIFVGAVATGYVKIHGRQIVGTAVFVAGLIAIGIIGNLSHELALRAGAGMSPSRRLGVRIGYFVAGIFVIAGVFLVVGVATDFLR